MLTYVNLVQLLCLVPSIKGTNQGRIQRWGGRGSSPPTVAAIMEPLLEPLLNFEGMKEMEEGL
jgi:hypothetical protein